MKAHLFLFVVFLEMLLTHVWALEDGLYLVSNKPTPISTTCLDGTKVYLDRKLADKIGSVSVVSRYNDNHEYFLDITRIALPQEGYSESAVLVLGDRGLSFSAETVDNSYIGSGNFISDEDFISRIEAFYHITREKRRHPGHQFTARFVPQQSAFSQSGPVIVTFEITNCGPTPFSVAKPSFQASSNCLSDPFAFSAYRSAPTNPEEIAVINKPSSPSKVSHFDVLALAQGASQSVSVDLRKYLKLDRAGMYNVRGSYRFQILDSTPAEKTLWDDYATAEFQVVVK
jgi:hypothetical protein